MGLFRHNKEEVIIGDQSFDLAGMVEKYNELLEKFDQVSQEKRHALAKKQQLQEQMNDLDQRYKRIQSDNENLQNKLGKMTGSQVVVDSQTLSSADLLAKYQQIQQDNQSLQLTLHQQNKQITNLQADNNELQVQLKSSNQRLTSAQAEVANFKEQVTKLQSRSSDQPYLVDNKQVENNKGVNQLINHYYDLVQAVLSDYQNQVKDIQEQLAQIQLDPYSLKLAKHNMTAKYYRQILTDRNDKMIRYVENHGRQARLVNQDDKAKNVRDNLRGIRYWGNFLALYRKELNKLLIKNAKMHDDFKFAYRQGKDRAKVIRDQKPFYLDEQNAIHLQEISHELGEYQQWKQSMDSFRKSARSFLLGVKGEQLVNSVVSAYTNNHVLYSLNLPYEYQKGKANSNQIDLIASNSKGIFIIEVKNYITNKIGINKDGYIVTSEDPDGTKNHKNIIRQGQSHYKAVYAALEKSQQLKHHMGYLKHHIHVLYVSTNPHAEIQPAPTGKPFYHFVNLDGLRREMDKSKGNLHPEIIQAVGQAFANAQQSEKEYPHYCFPENPTIVADKTWQQFILLRQLNDLNLDDLVKTKDSQILMDLDAAGFRTVNGYITSKTRQDRSYNTP